MGRRFLISVLILGILLLAHPSYANDQTGKKVEPKDTTSDNSDKKVTVSSASTDRDDLIRYPKICTRNIFYGCQWRELLEEIKERKSTVVSQSGLKPISLALVASISLPQGLLSLSNFYSSLLRSSFPNLIDHFALTILENTKPDLFLDWLRECGAKFDGLSVQNVTLDGRSQYGVFATSELEPFSEVARIPLSCGISAATALEHPDLKPIWEAHPHLTQGRSPMAIQLLWERKLGEKSKFARWISMLPPTLDLPMMWTRKERQALKGSYTLDRVLSDIEGLVEDYEKIFHRALFQTHASIFTPEEFTLDDYFWAWSIIWSRDIEQRVSGVWEAFLIPFVDMMNHKSEGGADIYVNFGKTDLVIRLNGSLAIGQELTRNYIQLAPNVELFRMYGFIDAQNPHIVSSIDFHLDKNEKYYARRVSWAKRFKIDIETDYPYNSLYITNKGIPPNIPALLRIANFNFDSRETWTLLKDAPDPFKRIANSVEERFFTLLKDILERKLNQFITTIEEDEALLANPALPYHQQLAIEMRLEEKIAIKGSIESLASTIVRFDEPIVLNRQRALHYPKRAASRDQA